MKYSVAATALVALLSQTTTAFVAPRAELVGTVRAAATLSEEVGADNTAVTEKELERQRLKRALLGRLGGPPTDDSGDSGVYDSVLADPTNKEPLRISFRGPILGGSTSRSGIRLRLSADSDDSRVFEGRTNTYINLLEPASAEPSDADEEKKSSVFSSPILSSLLTLTPPPLRSVISNATNSDIEYIPMRDLFTSPTVSFAYERGWRQGFSAAGFPGADKEFEMAKEYFAPVIEKKREKGEDSVLVDMSCATGLFTRRFAKSEEYTRVIACDYSDSMLTEARRRIRADPEVTDASTKLDLVRCDVAKIPLKTDSIDAFHAGAAMHCWPEIEDSLKEIHRVLVPGGRYFATTFLGNYFENVARAERASNGGNDIAQSMQAFQYFPDVEYLRDLLLDAGFEEGKVDLEVAGRGCVIIRCEK